MTSRFLRIFKPFTHVTFEVKKPDRTVSFKEKAVWTIVCLVVYFIMISVPLYGIETTTGQADPFFAMRAILASQRGTLGELGIGPIVTAGLIMQLLVGSQIIKVDFNNPEERALYTGAQKVLSVLMILTVSSRSGIASSRRLRSSATASKSGSLRQPFRVFDIG